MLKGMLISIWRRLKSALGFFNFPKWLKNFLNTEDEWHSFIVGLCESIHIFKPLFSKDNAIPEYIIKEYHYYIFGRALGFIILAFFILSLVKLGGA